MPSDAAVFSSFRDPCGFLFVRDGQLYRQVNECYRDHYERLISSGLYERLTSEGLLVRHEEVVHAAGSPNCYKTLRPEPVPFISYPYEWSFSAYKDAALATLRIQRIALEAGMSLRDASAYNIQFLDGRPTLIDTLSFEIYREGVPWVAYRQFCQHFLAPLALMSYGDARANLLMHSFIDGVPLDFAASFLPALTRLKLGLAIHIHVHGRMQAPRRARAVVPSTSPRRFARSALLGLLDQLEGTVQGLRWRHGRTTWSDYYAATHNYSAAAMACKERLVKEYIELVKPGTVWDLGANVGTFSRIAAGTAKYVVAFDSDPVCTDIAYRDYRERELKNVLPLVLDLTNPSPALGWAHRERMSLADRGPADLALALALVHHLAIGNNVPLPLIAEFLASICRTLIIEFVPKTDSQVREMLITREDTFPDYTQARFENEFGRFFSIVKCDRIEDSVRILYLMRRR